MSVQDKPSGNELKLRSEKLAKQVLCAFLKGGGIHCESSELFIMIQVKYRTKGNSAEKRRLYFISQMASFDIAKPSTHENHILNMSK